MKKFFVVAFIMLLGQVAFAQAKFEIKKIGSEYSAAELTSAFNGSDFCGSFFQSKRNLIVLNDGSEVELKSANELQAEGMILPSSCVLSDDTHFFNCIWSLAENGMLMKGFDTESHPTSKEYYQSISINEQ